MRHAAKLAALLVSLATLVSAAQDPSQLMQTPAVRAALEENGRVTVSTQYDATDGMLRVVVEDYVHGGSKTLTLVLITFIHAVVAAAGIFAVLKVAFGGAA